MLPLDKIPLLRLMEIANRLDFFEQFSLDEKKSLLDEKARCYICKKGQHLQKEGEYDNNFFLILSGEVSIKRAKDKTPLGQVHPGEFIGEGSFIANKPRSTSARAETDVILLCLDREKLSQLSVKIREKVKDAIISGMAKRIVKLNDINARYRQHAQPDTTKAMPD
ncbi:cyclic nucleotide-binding domain-containing protein [Thalassomonas viridans]|uniref:Cyclic nucleotide-binding domain-containing protein n=1 Tax=Thalassomonas viridans TaxID=137584 RepID=A0AAE9Z788_9GAMM|nr:cyclic nucleotide-binding domain-containing protein [Thalassomonas viridans]WDE07310.1 cyclic nucleotide-binding domain-containing protein [Thalassomonas viridans]